MRRAKLHYTAAVLGMFFAAAFISTAQTAASKPAIVLVHGGRNVGSVPGAELATYVVEKGQPLLVPVK